ncbi:MAG: DEAD/DEAH box helicase [Proteobacteria bacterium]|nr:DEAD/DEAH box helicase [Pseudomonadota bacterium]
MKKTIKLIWMSTLRIIIKKRLHLIDAPPFLSDMLQKKLTLQNPKWLENERMGRWNKGIPKTLAFYDILKSSLSVPRGLARWVILQARENNIDHTIDDRRRCLPDIHIEFQGSLKPFQTQAANVMLSKDFGTLNAPTGSGKTVMALFMIAARNQPATIIVHNKSLAHQWISRIETFLGIAEKEVGLVGDGKKIIGEHVTVALVQSVYKYSKEIARKTGFLVVDECHRTPSRTFTEAVSHFDSTYSLGLSATPYRRDNLSNLIFWYLGDAHHTIDKSYLVETGDILSAEIMIRKTQFKTSFDPVREYTKMLSELAANDERNRLIASDVAQEASDQKGAFLILSDRKTHCESLKTLLQYKYKINAEILTGDLNSNQRDEIIKRLKQGNLKVLIATGQLIGEGFDAENLATLFLATPVRFSGRILQYLGRVLRPSGDKQKARVFDYVDIHVDVLVNAAMARKKAYGRHATIYE